MEAAAHVRDRPSGTVRLNLPRLAADLVLSPVLPRLARDYPEVHLDAVVDDGFVGIVTGGFDAGIRPGERVQRDMVAVRLTPPLRLIVVGAPGYLARRPAPKTPDDLPDHACINYRWTGSGAVCAWDLARNGQRLEVAVDGPLTLNDTDLIVAATRDGVGLACLLEERVAAHLTTGELVQVLHDWATDFPGFFLYYPSRRDMRPALRVLIDALRMERPRTFDHGG